MQEISLLNNPGFIDNSYLQNININDIANIPGQDFYALINEHINKANSKDISDNRGNNNVTDINVKLKDSPGTAKDCKIAEKTDKSNAETVKKETTDNNISEAKNGKEDGKNVNNQKNTKTEKIKNDDEPGPENTGGKLVLADFIKKLNTILDSIKPASKDSREIHDIKAKLTGIEALGRQHNNAGFSAEKMTNKEILRIVDRIKAVLEKLEKNPEYKAQKQDADNKTISITDPNIKKKLLNIESEIKSLLAGESNKGKSNEINENKTITGNKFFQDVSETDKKDISTAKDSSANLNFSYAKKDLNNSEPVTESKNNSPLLQKGKIFDDQLNKVIQNAKIVIRDSKNGSFSIKLHPESLGKVNVNLNLEQGIILGKLLVETAEARDAMLENIAFIREKLQENGIAVGDFQVNVREDSRSFPDNENELMNFPVPEESVQTVALVYEKADPYYGHNGSINIIV